MGYAVLFDFSRLLILLVSDIDLMIAALAGLLLGVTMEITFGILLGYLLFRRRSWPGMSLLSVITRLEIGSYHYDLFSQNLLDRAHAHGLEGVGPSLIYPWRCRRGEQGGFLGVG